MEKVGNGPLRATFYRTCVVLLTLLAGYLLYRLGQIVLVLFIAIVFASTIRPGVEWLARRGLHRGVATLLIYLVVVGGLVALLILSVPPLAALTLRMVSEGTLISQIRTLVTDVFVFAWREFNVTLPIIQLPDQLVGVMGQMDAAAREQALPFARDTLGTLSQFFLALVMGFYWLTSREALLDLLLKVSPWQHRAQVQTVWDDIERTLGAYVRGQLTLMFAVGVACFVGLSLMRMPYAGALAVVAGLTEAVPIVGAVMGLVPALFVALTVSPTLALLVVILYVVIQQLESNILVPKVMEKNVDLNPLVVILALIAGNQLGGIVGALLAIPVAGALMVIARHLLIDPAIRSTAPVRMEGGAVLVGTPQSVESEAPTAAAAGTTIITRPERG